MRVISWDDTAVTNAAKHLLSTECLRLVEIPAEAKLKNEELHRLRSSLSRLEQLTEVLLESPFPEERRLRYGMLLEEAWKNLLEQTAILEELLR